VIEVTGIPELLEMLDGIDLSGVAGEVIKGLHRVAFQISPVDTGSYRASHKTSVKGFDARLYIDPAARNTRTGATVTSYAGAVEEMYNVYGRTANEADRMLLLAARKAIGKAT
jgi:hypothetical protein